MSGEVGGIGVWGMYWVGVFARVRTSPIGVISNYCTQLVNGYSVEVVAAWMGLRRGIHCLDGCLDR